jgi:hypothetical protein
MAGGLSQTLRLVVKGDAKGAVNALHGLNRGLTGSGRTGHMFGAMMRKGALLAAAGFAFMVAGLYVMIRVLRNVMRKSIEWMGGMVKLWRLTGLGAKALSLLAGQFRLSGVLIDKAATGVRFFQKNLYAAHLGTKTMVDTFKSLHVSLKDANGQWIDGATLLQTVRDRFSQMTDATKRTGLAVKLFGKGGADMLPWLMKSRDVMAGYTEDIKKFGMFTEKDIATYKKFMGNQRLMSYMWDMLKVKAGLLAMTLMNKVFPALKEMYIKYGPRVIGVVKDMAKWFEINGGKIRSSLGWIVNNKELVAGAMVLIWGAAGGPITKVLAAIAAVYAFAKWLDARGGKDTRKVKLTAIQYAMGGASIEAAAGIKPGSIKTLDEARAALDRIMQARNKVKTLRAQNVFSAAEAKKILATLDTVERGAKVKFFHFSTEAGTQGRLAASNLKMPFDHLRISDVPSPKITGAYAAGVAAGQQLGLGVSAGFQTTFSITVDTDQRRRGRGSSFP